LIKIYIPERPVAKQSFRYTKTGIRYQTKEVKEWQKLVAEYAKEAWHEPPIKTRLQAEITYYLPRNYADMDNLSKAILDALQKVIYHNDNQIYKLSAIKVVDKNITPGVLIKIDHYKE
jgi:Holliday junction resolvase RusA-like endonuclease